MDWSIILSITAIIVSVTVSGITLLLTELQGPDVTLVSIPKFEVDYNRMNQKRKEQEQLQNNLFRPVSASFETKPAIFVFANHGKKSGTITALDFKFSPEPNLKYGYHAAETKLTLSPKGPDLSAVNTPMTIESGANTVFFAITYIHTINWKHMALAETLDSSKTLEETIDDAIRKSRENFADFFEFIVKSPSLGTLSCDITYTKGRFETKIRTKKLFDHELVCNETSEAGSFFADFLKNWEDDYPTRQDLMHSVAYPFERLMEELKTNIQVLGAQITDQNVFNPVYLYTDQWRSLCTKVEPYLEIPQWFLIRSEKNLESELRSLYEDVERYSKLVGMMSVRKNYMSADSAQNALSTINKARAELVSKLETAQSHMKQLHAQKFG
jgi:hypothetical protein